jgi:hypothetical protein
MGEFLQRMGVEKNKPRRLTMMDMWGPFSNSTRERQHGPQAAILFGKFQVLWPLGEAQDQVGEAGYHRVIGKDPRFIKGQMSRQRSHREGITSDDRRSLRVFMKADRRLC